MGNTFIAKEVEKIMNSKEFEYPLNLAMTCAWIMGSFKAVDLKILKVTKLTSIAEYFVLASTANSVQALSIADEIIQNAKKYNQPILSQEGKGDSDWVLLDLGDVIVHLFDETARDKYALDDLWANAESIKIPDSYYYSHPELDNKSNEPQGNYF